VFAQAPGSQTDTEVGKEQVGEQTENNRNGRDQDDGHQSEICMAFVIEISPPGLPSRQPACVRNDYNWLASAGCPAKSLKSSI
jgi:hypothetical protein